MLIGFECLPGTIQLFKKSAEPFVARGKIVLPEQIPSINLGKLLGNIDILLKPAQRFFQPTGCGERSARC